MSQRVLLVKISFLLLMGFLLVAGCRATKEPVQNLAQGQSGEIAYAVPAGIDLTDIVSGNLSGKPMETVYGQLLLPAEAKDAPVPAVVIMHASGGVFSWREYKMAHSLNDVGIAAFIPYSFKARGAGNTGSTYGTGISFGSRLADAYAALNLLASHPGIDKKRIGIMGYSSGGIISLLAIDEKVSKPLAQGDLAFAAYVNVYASASYAFSQPAPQAKPMLFLIGEKDDMCPMDMVLEYAARLKENGAKVEAIVYKDAYHVFDSPSAVKAIPSADNDGGCRFGIGNDGKLTSAATGEAFSERDWPEHIAPCSTKGVVMGRNAQAAEQYVNDAVAFFLKNLR